MRWENKLELRTVSYRQTISGRHRVPANVNIGCIGFNNDCSRRVSGVGYEQCRGCGDGNCGADHLGHLSAVGCSVQLCRVWSLHEVTAIISAMASTATAISVFMAVGG